MYNKFFHHSLFLIFFLSLSCSELPTNFLLSPNKSIQILEQKDHQFCSELKIDYNQTKLVQSQLYWGCRLSITKRHFIKSNNPNYISHNRQINYLIEKINIKISNLPQGIIYHANKQIDEIHHNKCLKFGYEIATLDTAKIDDYFKCRSSLIDEYKLLPPYRNATYLDYPNKNYDLNFAINQQLEKNLKEFNKQKKLYPKCVKYNLYNPNFKLCQKAYDESRACHKKIPKKRYKKELNQKINCQRLSFIHFPDELIKFDDEEADLIYNKNNKYDYYNNNNFAALGLSASQFKAKKLDNKKEQPKNDDKESKNNEEKKTNSLLKKDPNQEINNSKELYTKFEITKLRQKYIEKCRHEVDKTIKEFITLEEFKCDELKKFEEVGE